MVPSELKKGIVRLNSSFWDGVGEIPKRAKMRLNRIRCYTNLNRRLYWAEDAQKRHSAELSWGTDKIQQRDFRKLLRTLMSFWEFGIYDQAIARGRNRHSTLDGGMGVGHAPLHQQGLSFFKKYMLGSAQLYGIKPALDVQQVLKVTIRRPTVFGTDQEGVWSPPKSISHILSFPSSRMLFGFASPQCIPALGTNVVEFPR